MTEIPLAEGLFTAGDEPTLLGQRCDTCATMSFPAARGCPRCSSEQVSVVELGRRGTLWTWTSQEFRPPAPPWTGASADDFEPYYLGYVELPGELRVETYLTGIEGRTPEIGEEMELVIVPFTTDDDGNQVVTYAFAPAGGS